MRSMGRNPFMSACFLTAVERSVLPKAPHAHGPLRLRLRRAMQSADFVRREKGASVQWEEDIPPGNCCSSRKQSKRGRLVTAAHEAFDGKVPPRRDRRAPRP